MALTSLLMRRISRDNTWPGPISTNVSTPLATISRTEPTHSTGATICDVNSVRMCSALVRTWPAMLVTTGTCGSRSGERSMISASRLATCCISGECDAMLMRNGTTVRAPASRSGSTEANDRGHAARAVIALLLHQPSALAHQAQRVAEVERARGDQGGVLTQTMAGDKTRWLPVVANGLDLFAHGGQAGHRHRHDGRLGVDRV